MKKLFIGLLVLGSLSVFAQDSDFERGYNKGKASCKNAQEAWLCTITGAVKDFGRGYTLTGQGPTRAEAILSIGSNWVNNAIVEGNELTCIKL